MKIKEAVFLTSARDFDGYPGGIFPEIAFSGRSNVGKSSMINCLMQRHNLARISVTPGRTQLINFYLVNGGISLADLPGYGYAKVSQEMRQSWKGMVEEYLEKRDQLKLVIVIVDLRRGLEDDDLDLLWWLKERGIQALMVATKSDKLKAGERRGNLEKIRSRARTLGMEVELFSARSGEGRDRLWARMLHAAEQAGRKIIQPQP